MSILGSLVVELKAQTASFIEGMDAAAKTSRSVGREIESSFSSIGSVAATALAPFGEFGSAIAETFAKVGESAGSAIQSFGKMGGAMGALGAAAAGASAALGAVSIGAIALATHTAESIAKVGELSQSSGISVGALSGLGFAGKTVGITMETVAASLEKMDKAVLKAATSPNSTTSAFSRLHISLRDAAGQIKPTEEIFGELAGRFANLPDGITKTALAMQIFGRGGAEIIPLLNQGQKGIQGLIETASALGVVLDEDTVKGAEQFTENLATIEEAGQGLAIHLTKDLLPALQTVTEFLVSGLKDKSSGLNAIVDGVAWLTKGFLTLGEVIYKILQQIGVFVGNTVAALVEVGTATYNALDRAAHFDWSGVVAAWQEGNRRVAAVDAQGAADSKKIWGEAGSFIKGIWSSQPKLTGTPQRTGTVDTTATKDSTLESIRVRIAALQQEQVGWLNVSHAGTQAEQLIAEAIKKGNDEFNKLKTEAARDKDNPATATALVVQNEALIRGAAASGVYGAAIRTLLGDLDKESEKLREQGNSVAELGAAYAQGGSAIAQAAIDKQFAAEAAKVDVFKEALNSLSASPEKNAAAMKQFSDAIAIATKNLEEHKAAASAIASAQLTVSIQQEASAFQNSKQYVDDLSDAYLKGSNAVRAARIELELFQFKQQQLEKGVVVTPVQEKQKRVDLTNQDQQAYDDAIKQAAAQYDLNTQYDDEITRLQRIREAIQTNGDSTLLIDTKIFEAQNSLIHQWDESAFAVGTFGQRFRGVMNELVIQGQQAGAEISKAFLTAIDGVETSLAKLLTGQKANFKQVAQGLAESIVKAGIQKEVGNIAGAFGIHVGIGKPDGTSGNPLHVVVVRGIGALAGGSGSDSSSPGGGKGGIFGKILGSIFGGSGGGSAGLATPDGTISNPFYVLDAAAATGTGLGAGGFGGGIGSLLGIGAGGEGAGGGEGGGIGSIFSTILSTIPFLEGGGDVTPGKAYVVGEKRPELFVPKVAGEIRPSVRTDSGRTSNVSITNHFHVAENTDLFRKSPTQMNAEQFRQMSIATSRGR